MLIIITCYKGATYADQKSKRYKVKTLCEIRKTPFRESYYINGMSVSRKTCLEPIK